MFLHVRDSACSALRSRLPAIPRARLRCERRQHPKSIAAFDLRICLEDSCEAIPNVWINLAGGERGMLRLIRLGV